MPGIIQTLRTQLDQASVAELKANLSALAETVASSINDRLEALEGNEAGKKAALGVIAGLREVFDRDMAAIAKRFEEGAIDPAGFERDGVEAATRFNAGVRSVIEKVQNDPSFTMNPLKDVVIDPADVDRIVDTVRDAGEAAGDALEGEMTDAGRGGGQALRGGIRETDLRPEGMSAGRMFLDALLAHTRFRQSEVKEELLRGFITEDEARRRGEEIGRAHTQAILREMERLRGSGLLTPEDATVLMGGIGGAGGGTPPAGAVQKVNALTGAWGGLRSMVASVGAYVGAAFAIHRIVSFGKESVRAFRDDEAAARDLEVAARGAGLGVDGIRTAAERMGEAFTEAGIASGGQVNRTLAQLIGISGDAGKSLANLNVIADLAAAKNISWAQATDLVGRAMVGNTTGLRKHNIEVKKGEDAVKAIGRATEGFAAKQGPTLEKSLNRLSFLWVDFKAAVGEALVEAGGGTSVMDTLAAAVKGLTRWVQENRDVVKEFGSIVATVVGWLAKEGVKAVESFTNMWRATRKEFALVSTQWQEAGGILKLAAGAFVGGVSLMIAGWAKFKQFMGFDTSVADAMVAGLRATADRLITEGNKAIDDANARWEKAKKDNAPRMRGVLSGSGSTDDPAATKATEPGGVRVAGAEDKDPLQTKIALLKEAMQFAATAAQAMDDLDALEEELSRRLKRRNLTLKERVDLEAKLLEVRAARASGFGADEPLAREEFRLPIPPIRGPRTGFFPMQAPEDPDEVEDRQESRIREILERAGEIAPEVPINFREDLIETFFDNLEEISRGAAEGIGDTFEDVFSRIGSDSLSLSEILGQLGKGMAKSLLREIAQMAKGKALESVAHAIEETAKGFAALASFNPAAASLHFKAAGGFALSAVKWGLVAGGVGALSGGGGGGGGGGGSREGEREDPLKNGRPKVEFIIKGGLLSTDDSRQMDALASAIRSVTDRDVVIRRGKAAGIVWGTAFAKTLRFGFPMLDAETYPMNRGSSEIKRASEAGVADGWSRGGDRFLAFRLPAIPTLTEADPYGYGEAAGWESADGWRDFLAWGRRKNVLRFCPVIADYLAGNTTTYLESRLKEPWTEPPAAGWSTRRELRVVLKVVEDSFAVGY